MLKLVEEDEEVFQPQAPIIREGDSLLTCHHPLEKPNKEVVAPNRVLEESGDPLF